MDTKAIIADLHAQRDRIDNAITALEALNGAATSAKSAKAAAPGIKTTATTKRVIPEARQRMALAQQKRWAKKKRAVKAVAKKAADVVPAAVKA